MAGHRVGKHSKVNVFAYGSNMSRTRLQERVATAAALHTGFVPNRRLAFHKRSVDGSAKCNATFTGSASDHVWGVIYRMSHRDTITLDQHEWIGVGYHREEVDVVVGRIARFSLHLRRLSRRD